MIETPGLHHVTAIAGDPQASVDVYTKVIGLRLVKQTMNFDDTFTYHLYYGDATGTPGTVFTVFPFVHGTPGRVGGGQPSETAFTVPPGSAGFWADHLSAHGIDVDEPHTRFGETVVPATDHDGLRLILVEGETDIEPWTDGPIPDDHAIRGFHGVVLDSLSPTRTGEVLERLGFDRTDRDDDLVRYRSGEARAGTIDVRDAGGVRGNQGIGTVHHVAFRVPDEATQLAWRDELVDGGLQVTPQRDRRYFTSVYFREPGSILFEIATDGPGFTRDEAPADLGTSLKLPPWLEEDREMIERQLPAIDLPASLQA